ncbi:unnamed protein product, partial [Sphacelaria rigidula]
MLHQTKSPPVPDSELWTADSGTSHHTTGSMTDVFDTRPPPVGKENIVLGNGKVLPIKAVGSLKLRS